MKRLTTICILLTLFSGVVVPGVLAQIDNDCRSVSPIDGQEHTAIGYPLPLSLRRNLVYIVKAEMIRRGEYIDETLQTINGVFTDRLQDAVAAAQRRLDQEPTGCLTWEIVRAYDTEQR